VDDKRKAQKTLDACQQQVGTLEQQRDRLTAELEAARGERQKLLRALALGEAKERDLAKVEAELGTLTGRLEGTDGVIVEVKAQLEQAQAVLSEFQAAEAAEQRRRRTAELTEKARTQARQVKEAHDAFCWARGEWCVTLSELEQLDKGAAQGIGSTFSVGAGGSDPLRTMIQEGSRPTKLDGNHASDVLSCFAMLAPAAAEPFVGRDMVNAFEVVQIREAKAAEAAAKGAAHADRPS
jgi:hypothetical protein